MTYGGSYTFEDAEPTIHDEARVSREATLVGEVTVAADASVWPGAVLRGDVAPVSVGVESHVGDNAILHAVTLGDRVMVGYEIPPHSFARGVPAGVTPLEETDVDAEAIFETFSSDASTDLAGRHEQLFE